MAINIGDRVVVHGATPIIGNVVDIEKGPDGTVKYKVKLENGAIETFSSDLVSPSPL